MQIKCRQLQTQLRTSCQPAKTVLLLPRVEKFRFKLEAVAASIVISSDNVFHTELCLTILQLAGKDLPTTGSDRRYKAEWVRCTNAT